MSVEISDQEKQQLEHTIEMFEVIAQSQPDDYQSYEILKEAYEKLGQEEKALETSQKLAHAYAKMGQFSSAAMECEGILRRVPDQQEISNLLQEVENQMSSVSDSRKEKATINPVEAPPPKAPEPTAEAGQEGKLDEGGIIEVDQTNKQGAVLPKKKETSEKAQDNGNEALARFLTEQNLIQADPVLDAMEKVRELNQNLSNQGLAACLIDELAQTGTVEEEALLSGMLDRIKFGFIPLEHYDVDRQIVKMLPEELTLGRLIVPFDLMSRTLMIALVNPFDAVGREQAESMVDYQIQWYLASPSQIYRILRDAYRLDSRDYPPPEGRYFHI